MTLNKSRKTFDQIQQHSMRSTLEKTEYEGNVLPYNKGQVWKTQCSHHKIFFQDEKEDQHLTLASSVPRSTECPCQHLQPTQGNTRYPKWEGIYETINRAHNLIYF